MWTYVSTPATILQQASEGGREGRGGEGRGGEGRREEGGREGRERGREGGREGGKEGGKEGGREGVAVCSMYMYMLAEHWTSNPVVMGSNPIRGSSVFFSLSAFRLCLTLSCLPLHIHVQDLIMFLACLCAC